MERRDLASLLFLLITPLLFSSCTQAKRSEPDAPAGWKKIEAGKFFTFSVPESMQLVSEETCMECLWGSTYSDSRIRLGVEFTSWNEEYAPEDLAKQADYTKQIETKRSMVIEPRSRAGAFSSLKMDMVLPMIYVSMILERES